MEQKLERLGYRFKEVADGWYVTRYPYAPDLGTYATKDEAVEAAYQEAIQYPDFRRRLKVDPPPPANPEPR